MNASLIFFTLNSDCERICFKFPQVICEIKQINSDILPENFSNVSIWNCSELLRWNSFKFQAELGDDQ